VSAILAFINLGVKYEIGALLRESKLVLTSEFPIALPPHVLLREDFTRMHLLSMSFVECINKLINAAKKTAHLANILPALRYIAANFPSAEIFHSPYLTNEDRLSILECRDGLKERSRGFDRRWRNRTPACDDCQEEISHIRSRLEFRGLEGWHAEWDGEFCNETCREEVRNMFQRGREDIWDFLVATSADLIQ
jgi:hypothetical protein